MARECKDFMAAQAGPLAHYSEMFGMEYAGHDFWLTKNGHGAGFWDRGIGETGRALTDAAHVYGSTDLFAGADGKLYS